MDGGCNHWRRQEIDEHRGPPGRYNDLRLLLSNPPEDKYWLFDKDTKEWTLVDKQCKGEIVAIATLIDQVEVDDDNDIGNECTTSTVHNDTNDNSKTTIPSTTTTTTTPSTTATNGTRSTSTSIPQPQRPQRPQRQRLHDIQYTDTFDSICLQYKVTPCELRSANYWFSGTDLLLAPNPLVIPTRTESYVEAEVVSTNSVNNRNNRNGGSGGANINNINTNNNNTTTTNRLTARRTPSSSLTTTSTTNSSSSSSLSLPPPPLPNTEDSPELKEFKLRRLCKRLSKSEARCYLELNDWDLAHAITNAREDGF